jgi:hypothetical protein
LTHPLGLVGAAHTVPQSPTPDKVLAGKLG